MSSLDEAKVQLENVVVYLAKLRVSFLDQAAQADKALADATRALITVEETRDVREYIAVSSTPIGDSFGVHDPNRTKQIDLDMREPA